MRVIIVSGIDGSGKSTQLALLKRYLELRGFSVGYAWLRWFAAFTYLLYLYARIMKRTIVVKSRSRPVHIHVFWIDPVLRVLYPRVLLLDLLMRFTLSMLVARLRSYDVLLIDRFVLDVVVDLLWEVRDAKILRCTLVRVLWKYVRNTIILVVEPKEAAKRKSDIVSLKEVAFKRRCFEVFAKYFRVPVIDTTKISILDTFKELVKHVNLYIYSHHKEKTFDSS